MNPNTHPHFQIVGPGAVAERALDGHRRHDGSGSAIEDCEELVGARIDLTATRPQHRRPDDASDLIQDGAIAITQLAEQRWSPRCRS